MFGKEEDTVDGLAVVSLREAKGEDFHSAGLDAQWYIDNPDEDDQE